MLRVSVVWSGFSGGPYFSQLYFGGDTSGEAAAAVAAVQTLLTDLRPFVSATLTATIDQEVDVVDPVTGQTTATFTNAGASVVMTGAGDVLPFAAQGLVRFRTGVYNAGREIRGRFFVPGPLESSSIGGVPGAAYTSGVATAITTFLTGAAPAGDHGVWSPTHGAFAPTVSRSVWTQWAILRSRRD